MLTFADSESTHKNAGNHCCPSAEIDVVERQEALAQLESLVVEPLQLLHVFLDAVDFQWPFWSDAGHAALAFSVLG